MNSNTKDALLLAAVNFPLYCVKSITDRHILIAGGGGQAKTGVPNSCEIYELVYDKLVNNVKAVLITKFSTSDLAIMNMCLIDKTKDRFTVCAGGMNGICNIFDVRIKFINDTRRSSTYSESNRTSTPSNLRHRTFSFSSQRQSSVEDGVTSFDQYNEEKGNNINSIESIKKNDPVQRNVVEHRFEFKMKKTIKTDFSEDEAFQKMVRYSPAISNRIFTAGADGIVRLWSHPDYNLVAQIEAHNDEVDDIDIHPKGKHLVTVSRDGANKVWKLDSMELLCKLDHRPAIPTPKNQIKLAHFQTARYICKGCRYGIIERNDQHIRLYTILNPAVRTKPQLDSFLCSWSISNTNQYRIEKITSTGDVNIFSLTISDDGRFLALGTLDGDVNVYISFSLQRCYYLPKAHNFFVTGLEFLPSTDASLSLMGDNVDTALISISIDNHVVLHKIPKQTILGFFGSFTLYTLFMFCVYLFINYLNL